MSVLREGKAPDVSPCANGAATAKSAEDVIVDMRSDNGWKEDEEVCLLAVPCLLFRDDDDA